MTERYRPIDLSRVRTQSIGQRENKVDPAQFAVPGNPGRSFRAFYESLPDQLGAVDLRAVVDAVVRAARTGRPVIWGMGGHVVKTGISPLVIDLMRRGVVTAVAMNGGASIHDCEVAFNGGTSEDVQQGIRDGTFGFWEETGSFYNSAVNTGSGGLGSRLGAAILASVAPYRDRSILAEASALGLPATVHITPGADIVHMHPQANGSALGAATYEDFLIFTSVVADLGDGGVYLNVGSAVTLPELFLKAISVARNLGHPIHDFTTANFDMIQHYRPNQNVVRRPTDGSGRGYSLTGQHEILLPLFVQAVVEAIGPA